MVSLSLVMYIIAVTSEQYKDIFSIYLFKYVLGI